MSGGGGKEQTVGYKYYTGMHMALCKGPVDRIIRIRVDERVVASSSGEGGTPMNPADGSQSVNIQQDEIFGGESREGGISGQVDFEDGNLSQGVNSYLQSVLGGIVPAFRGVASLILRQVYIGVNPYMKKWDVRLKRIFKREDGSPQWNPMLAEVGKIVPYNIQTMARTPGTVWAGDFTAYYVEGRYAILNIVVNGNPQYRILDLKNLTDDSFYFSFPGAFSSGYQPTQRPYIVTMRANTGMLMVDVRNGDILCSTHLSPQPLFNGAGCYDAGFQYWFQYVVDPLNPTGPTSHYKLWKGPFELDAPLVLLADQVKPFSTYGVEGIPYIKNGWIYGVMDMATFKLVRVNTTTGEKQELPEFLQAATILFSDDGIYARTTDDNWPYDNPILRLYEYDTFDLLIERLVHNSFGVGTAPCLVNAGRVFNTTSQTRYYQIAELSGDMNPAHIIRECLIDEMGYTSGDIDNNSFAKAAQTLFDEGMGISILWDTQMEINKFVQLIIKHINAALYVDRKTGLFKLKLIRADYDEASLLVLNEDNIERITDFKQATLGELTNSVTVTYWDKKQSSNATLTVSDIALVQAQNSTNATSINYEGFTNSEIASRVALRDLKALSTPLISCTVYTNRFAKDLDVGDCFKMQWPDFEVGEVIMRIVESAYGDGKSNSIRFKVVQDVFAQPAEMLVSSAPTGWINPTELPVATTLQYAFEAPYFELVQRQGQQQTESMLEFNPDAGYVGAGAVRPQSSALTAELFTDPGTGYESAAHLDFAPGGTLAADVGYLDDNFAIADFVEAFNIKVDDWLQIDDELCGVVSFDDNSVQVIRGVLDTVPTPHSAGAAVVVWDRFAEADPVEYTIGEIVNVKISTITGGGKLALADADEMTVELKSRAIRPYAPGNLTINGEYFPSVIEGAVSLLWASRNRIQQTGGVLIGFTDGDVTSEPGVTYFVRVYAEDGVTLIDEVTGITGSGYNWIQPFNKPQSTTTQVIEVGSERDGYESFQAHRVTLERVGLGYNLGNHLGGVI